MTESEQHPIDFLPELALGVLPEEQSEPIRAHLRTCDECRAEYAEMRRVADFLPFAAEDRVPSAGVRAAIFERIREEPISIEAARLSRVQATHRPGIKWLAGAAAAAALFVAAAGVGGFLIGDSGSDSGVSETQFQRYASVVRAVVEGDVARIESTSADGAHVVIVGDRDSDLAYAWVEGMPALPDGKAYQLWLSPDGAAFQPSTVFKANQGGFWFTGDRAFTEYALMGFTIEDEAGAEAPTQAPFLVVDLSGSAHALTP
ncbi:MAG TPA: anti-sigma factor [Tepidiformaceae bacterium]|nr:anti-sigma factor [Tepidiformaceae bacterium]